MTINTNYHRTHAAPVEFPISGVIEKEIDRASDGNRGAVECLGDEHRHLVMSFALLVETLAAKGLLTAPEVVKIACHYDADPEAAFA